MERDITELFLEIAGKCQFDPKEDGLEQWFRKCREWLGLEKERKIETDEKENEEENEEEESEVRDVPESLQNIDSPFYIRNSGQILKIEREEELEEYKRKIGNLENLEQVIEKYPEERMTEDWLASTFRLVKRMVQGIRDKENLRYEEDENNAVHVANYIQKQILKKHIKKVITALFRMVHQKGLNYQPIKELLDAINQYLEQLGVYTIVAQPGGYYKDVITFYGLIYDRTKGSHSEPIITEVECPAYLVKYRDEEDRACLVWSEGSCIGK